MKSIESIEIANFKQHHADVFAWLYSTCRESSQDTEVVNFGKKLLNFSAMLDVDYGMNLIEYIKRKVGIHPADIEEADISKVFAKGQNPTYDADSGWGDYIRKIFTIDLGMIEELFDEILEGLIKIYDFIKEVYQDSVRKAHTLLEEMSIIIETLKTMRNNMPLMVHLQTRLETSQSAELSIA